MSDVVHVETINELKIWLEGKFELIRTQQSNNAEEIRTLRKTVHETNNAVSGLLLLDIPGKLEQLKEDVKAHDTVIEGMGKDQAAFKAMVRTAYVAIGIAGAAFGAVVTWAIQFVK